MKKTLLLTSVLLTFSASVFSQQAHCGFDDVHGRMKQTDPKYAQGLLEMANGMQLLQEGGYLNQSNNPSRAVRTIPVVVHVVLNTQAKQNTITDTKIINMISSANTYFRKTVSLSGLRSAFTGVATDTEIELCLAQRDPSGNPTNGITRLLTDSVTFVQGNSMKRANSGGVNPWNQQKYLNVWVVDLAGSSGSTGGTGGYAYLPTPGMPGSANDGIVLEFEVGFWDPGSTLAHETGHYLGLFHTWGENQGCPSGAATFANGYDDGFSDTPDSDGPNMTKSCGSSNVLSCGVSAPGDQYENLMDYSNCPLIFTAQQSSLMNIILNGSGLSSPFTGQFGYRSSLVNNNQACVPTSGPAPSFTASANSICVGQSVTYTNTTVGAASVSWSFPGGTPSSSTSTTTVTVTYNTPGSYTTSLTATNADGTNSTTQTVTVLGASVLPLVEGFQIAAFPPAGWTLNNVGSDTYTWERTTATTSASVRVNNYAYNASGAKDWLITPAYDFSAVASGKLKFDYAYTQYRSAQGAYSRDSLQILYSTDCGTTWNSLWYKGGESLATTNPTYSANSFTPTASQWETDSISLSFLAGQANVRFAFVNICRYGNNTYLDNINLYNGTPPSGSSPTANFSASSVSVCAGSTITFTNQSVNGASWNWSFGGGGTPNTSTAQSPTVTFNTAGTYTVSLTATNASGSDTKTSTVTVNAKPTATASTVPVNCFGASTGSATVSASGGLAGYTYNWTGGGSTATISNKAAGSYTVTVTDSRGCTATATATVTQPSSALSVSISKTNAGCGALGSAAANASGGTAGYTYAWSNSGQTQSVSVSAGTYFVTVTDVNGCTVQGSVAVTESNLSIVSSSAAPATGGQANGTATVVAAGAEPITYSWSNGMTGSSISGLANGSYDCTVTDANGCTATVKVNVGNDGTGVEALSEIEKIALFPNPAQNQVQLEIVFKTSVKFSYTVHDALGRVLMQSPVYSDKTYSELIPVNNWANGIYTVQLKTDSGIQTLKFIKQ